MENGIPAVAISISTVRIAEFDKDTPDISKCVKIYARLVGSEAPLVKTHTHTHTHIVCRRDFVSKQDCHAQGSAEPVSSIREPFDGCAIVGN